MKQLGEVKGADPLDLNTITERENVGVTMSKADGLGTGFTRTFALSSLSSSGF